MKTEIRQLQKSNPQKVSAKEELKKRDDKVLVTKKRFWKICNKKIKDFQVDKFNQNILKNIVLYLAKDERCEWDIKKDLFFFGHAGVGKTVLVECMQEYYKRMNMGIRFVECAGIEDELYRANNPIILEKYYKGNIIFNDLGLEPVYFNHYSNRIPIMEKILFNREIFFSRGQQYLTLITSNKEPEEIETRYGTRIADRFEKMFFPVFVDGPSRRGGKQKNFRIEEG